MRVALYHNLTSGGSKREAHEYTRQLVRAGHTVHVFRPSTANEQFLSLEDETAHQSYYDFQLLPDLRLRLPGFRKYGDLAILMRNIRRLDKLARRIAADIDAGGYDFVLVHHDQIVQSPYLLRHLRTPSAYYCAEPPRGLYEPTIPRAYQQPKSWLGRAQSKWYRPERLIREAILRREESCNIRGANLLLTNSFFSAEAVYRSFGLRAKVAYLGVNTDLFRPLDVAKENIVLSVGAISAFKGYDFLIEALGQISNSERPRLAIVGNSAANQETQFLRDLAARHGVTVQFCVNVNDDELVKLYNQARAFVYTPVLEPFGFAPLEAMACGTPVVAVKEGGIRESVIDGVTGMLVERDTKIFADALTSALTNPKALCEMGKSGRKHVLYNWTWAQAYERLIGHISQIQKA